MKPQTKFVMLLVVASIVYYGVLITVITARDKIRGSDAVITPIRSYPWLRQELGSLLKISGIGTGSIFQEEFGFQPVTQDGLYVYSAFLGIAGEFNKMPNIIIIGTDMTKTKARRNLSCEFYGEIPLNKKGKPILEGGLRKAAVVKQDSSYFYNIDQTYCPIFIHCDIPKAMERPKFVVVKNARNSSQNIIILRIHYPPKEPIYNVAACVQPLIAMENVTDHNQIPLIEWLEFNKMMGVEHFTFYNPSASPLISKVLESYKEVSILPWNKPITPEPGIRARGQFIQANDCAHRYRGVARFVIALDIDEFLIPSRNFSDYFTFFRSIMILDEVQKLHPINNLVFIAVFSFSNWRKRINMNLTAANYNVGFLRLPTMTTFVGSRQTKVVMLPENIVESGVHFAGCGRLSTIL